MTTKIIMCQPATNRYKWELVTAIVSIRELTDLPIVLLFVEEDNSVVDFFRGRYENVELHTYDDRRVDKTYPANTRPYLMWRYLEEDPSREKDRYFQIDCDVIFREWPDISHMTAKGILYGSDCGGYIDGEYLRTRKRGDEIIRGFAQIIGVSEDVIRTSEGVGAQFVFTGATADLWREVYDKSNELYHYLYPIDSDIQKWTAEMWAQLFVFAKHGFTAKIEPELEFCRPTDPVVMWEHTKILHNAGVTEDNGVLLYKGKYFDKSPFDEDLSWVRRDKAGWHYARAVDKAAGKL